MATLTLSETSPTNTTLTDLYGSVVYEVSTPFSLGGGSTTIKRNGQVLAIVKWALFGGSELTMGGVTAPLNDVFPKTGILSDSRVFTTANGERLKWKADSKLKCVSADSGLSLATYNPKPFATIRSKKSTLDISSNAAHLIDILVVTWVIAGKKAQDRKEALSSGADAVSDAVADGS